MYKKWKLKKLISYISPSLPILKLALILSLLLVGLYLALNQNQFNFDTNNQAAGEVIFVNNTNDLQAVIDKAGISDAIFLQPGEYRLKNSLQIKNKKIRILGSGAEFTTIVSNVQTPLLNIENSEISIESVSITGSASDGIKVTGNSTLYVRDVNISRHSGAGISFAGSKLEVQRATLEQNGEGITTSSNSLIASTIIKQSVKSGITINNSTQLERIIISNTILSENKGTAIYINGGKQVDIQNATIFNNGKGIVEATNSVVTTIKNTIIQGNSIEGASLQNNKSSIKYTSLYNNGGNITPQSLPNQEGILTLDAKFRSEQDLRLSKESPLKDKGTPNEFDPDGTRIDLGAYGGSHILIAPNAPPTIKSKPNEYIKPYEKYNYTIEAEDPDGDELIFSNMSTLPEWLNFDKNVLTGSPSENHIGHYGVIIVISDRKGGNIAHPVNINVIPASLSVPITPTPDTRSPQSDSNNIPTPSPTSPTTSVIPVIQITKPQAGEILNKSNNTINWKILPETAQSQIESITLSYSVDGENYQEITKLQGNSTSYKWENIDKVTPGKYFLKVEAKDSQRPDLKIAAISSQFEIKASEEEKPTLTITKNSPADNDIVKDNKIQIVVEFKPEVDLNKAQTKLIVNGNEVAYGTTRNTLYYQPVNPYNTNKVKVEVYLVATNGASASKQWVFNIEQGVSPGDTTPDVVVQQQICLFGSLCLPRPIGLVCIGSFIFILLIIIAYLVVKIIKTIRDQRSGYIESEFSDFYGEKGIIDQYQPNTNKNEIKQPETSSVQQNSDTSDYQTYQYASYPATPDTDLTQRYYANPNEDQKQLLMHIQSNNSASSTTASQFNYPSVDYNMPDNTTYSQPTYTNDVNTYNIQDTYNIQEGTYAQYSSQQSSYSNNYTVSNDQTYYSQNAPYGSTHNTSQITSMPSLNTSSQDLYSTPSVALSTQNTYYYSEKNDTIERLESELLNMKDQLNKTPPTTSPNTTNN